MQFDLVEATRAANELAVPEGEFFFLAQRYGHLPAGRIDNATFYDRAAIDDLRDRLLRAKAQNERLQQPG